MQNIAHLCFKWKKGFRSFLLQDLTSRLPLFFWAIIRFPESPYFIRILKACKLLWIGPRRCQGFGSSKMVHLQDDNLYDVLALTTRLLSERPATMVPAFDRKKGLAVVFKLINSVNELIRIPALKIFGYFLCRSTLKWVFFCFFFSIGLLLNWSAWRNAQFGLISNFLHLFMCVRVSLKTLFNL